jgi:hypothetical protein
MTYTTQWSIKMTEQLPAPSNSLLVGTNNIPNYNMTFSNADGKEVGQLDFNGDTMKFSGNAEESAQVFFDWIAESFESRLLQERKREYDRCVKLVERSKVIQFIWYPKGYSIGANKIGDIYQFQYDRTLKELTQEPPK